MYNITLQLRLVHLSVSVIHLPFSWQWSQMFIARDSYRRGRGRTKGSWGRPNFYTGFL